MKKFITVILSLALICVLTVPAMAEILQSGHCSKLVVPAGKTVTIPEGETVWLDDGAIELSGTLEIYGTIEGVVNSIAINDGKIVLGKSGYINLGFDLSEAKAAKLMDELCRIIPANGIGVSRDVFSIKIHTHNYENQVCTVCGTECKNSYHEGICPECGLDEHAVAAGSVLSEGSLAIVVGVAAAVVFGIGGFLFGRKKKPYPVSAGGPDDE